MRLDGTLEFEAALRALTEDDHSHHAQMASAVPPFLQELLLRYSLQLAPSAGRYSLLVDELLRLPAELQFVSFNYDTLLDWHLDTNFPLTDERSYVENPRLALIKPHGSVAWYVPQPEAFDLSRPPEGLVLNIQPIECVPIRDMTLAAIRGIDDETDRMSDRYPALAMPLGPKDELTWPPEHRQRFDLALRKPEIHLLVLGYSGLDQEILRRIADSQCRIRRLTVVDADAPCARTVLRRLLAAGLDPIWLEAVPDPLSTWIDGTGMRRWREEYATAFSMRPPDEVREELDVLEEADFRDIVEASVGP